MVKSIIKGSSSVFIVCFIGFVGASKLAGASLEAEESLSVGEFGPHSLNHIPDEILFEELTFRGYGGPGFGRGGFRGPGVGPVLRRPHIPFSRRGHLRGGGPVGAIGAVGAAGGVKNKEASLNAIEADNRNRDRVDVENSQAGLVAAGKKLDVGQQTNLHNSNGILHSHKDFDNKKVLLKESNRGSDDLDVIRNTNDLSSGSHLSKGSGILAAGANQNRFDAERDNAQHIGALNAQDRENSAAGVVGAGGAVGAL